MERRRGLKVIWNHFPTNGKKCINNTKKALNTNATNFSAEDSNSVNVGAFYIDVPLKTQLL